MHIETLDTDILLFRGAQDEALATAFIDGQRVLLVDTLASVDDARAMRQHLDSLQLKVESIILTHCDTDHTAGLPLFPGAQIIAQRLFLHTQAATGGVVPTLLFDRQYSLSWGRHQLELRHNPGKTVCMIAIEVPTAGLLFTADNIVGHIAYVGQASPELIDSAIAQLQEYAPARLVLGHMGVQDWSALADARHYLARLRAGHTKLEDCLAPGRKASAFEQHWHQQNLVRIAERKLFTHRAPAPTFVRCCTSVLDAITMMFGQLAQRGH